MVIGWHPPLIYHIASQVAFSQRGKHLIPLQQSANSWVHGHGGTPKWKVSMRESAINGWWLGVALLEWKPKHMVKYGRIVLQWWQERSNFDGYLEVSSFSVWRFCGGWLSQTWPLWISEQFWAFWNVHHLWTSFLSTCAGNLHKVAML